jgi:hypothetical protein
VHQVERCRRRAGVPGIGCDDLHAPEAALRGELAGTRVLI